MARQVLTANRLTDGLVVYLADAGGWSERIDEARTAADAEEAQRLLAEGERSVEARIVVGPYLIDVDADNQPGKVAPLRFREAIRSQGPTVPSDFRSPTSERS